MTKGSDRLILACQRAIYSSRFFFYFAQSGGNNTLNKKFLSYLLFKFSTENVIILYTLDIESLNRRQIYHIYRNLGGIEV